LGIETHVAEKGVASLQEFYARRMVLCNCLLAECPKAEGRMANEKWKMKDERWKMEK
jgi:hypothetical protein